MQDISISLTINNFNNKKKKREWRKKFDNLQEIYFEKLYGSRYRFYMYIIAFIYFIIFVTVNFEMCYQFDIDIKNSIYKFPCTKRHDYM